MKIYTILLTVFSLAALVFGDVINVPGDQATIQAGINVAADGDTVLVAENTYYENINFKGKAITVASHFLINGDTTHIDSTIINGSLPSDPNEASVVTFNSGEDTTSVLCGFTITGGTGTTYTTDGRHCKAGGGIFSYNSGPRICNNHIENNKIYHTTRRTLGGGIFTGPVGSDTHIIIEENVIQFNKVEAIASIASGGGMRISSNAKIHRNQINNNEAKCSAGEWMSAGGGITCYNENIKPFKFVTFKDNAVTNNQTVSSEYFAGSSGADFVYTNSVVENNIITNNIANGATAIGSGIRLFSSDSASVVKNNLISFNIGGGLLLYYTEGLTVQENLFENNEGSGIDVNYCLNTQIIQNKFFGNVSGSGGGIYESETTNTVILDNEIIGNSAGSGGGIFEYKCTNNLITKNRISGNSAGTGGGVQIIQSDNCEITNNEITENEANVYSGGGFFIYDSHPKFIKNLICGNRAASYGGGLAILKSNSKKNSESDFYKQTLHSAGTEILENELIQPDKNTYKSVRKVADDDETIFINNTITRNIATLGGGIYNEFEKVKIINTIIWGDSATIDNEINNDGGTIEVMYSDIQDSVWTGVGNISADPLFADTLLYNLVIGSPCIDAGHPDESYNDEDGSINDMGAYGGNEEMTGFFEIDDKQALPDEYVLLQNYPNPFNPITNIEFQIPSSQFVTLKIYNILGQEVTTLVSEKLMPGSYKYVWNAFGFASGVYVYELSSTKGITKAKKLILLK